MSADNYYFVFKRGQKYVVQCRFASCEYRMADLATGGVEFDTFAEADAYAHDEYSEYGVSYGFQVERREAAEARAAEMDEKGRLAVARAKIAERRVERLQTAVDDALVSFVDTEWERAYRKLGSQAASGSGASAADVVCPNPYCEDGWVTTGETATNRAYRVPCRHEFHHGYKNVQQIALAEQKAAEARCARLQQALAKADKAASKAHDAMWAMDFDKTAASSSERDAWKRLREQASDAIWAIHNLLRPLMAREALAGPDTPADSTEPMPEACPRCGCLTYQSYDRPPFGDAPDGAVICDNCGKGWVHSTDEHGLIPADSQEDKT